MKVNRDQFLKAIKAVHPATSNIEDMSNLYFSGKEVVAYNDRICIHFPFESDFVFLINGTLLSNFLERVSSDEVMMSVKENKLILKSKDEKATLTTVIESEIISRVEKVKEELTKLKKKTIPLPSDFVEGASLCMFSASNEPADGTLTCLSVNGKEIVSTDKGRISIYTMADEMPSIMFESSVASELEKFSEMGLTKCILSDSWIHFIADDGPTLSVRKILGGYPDLQKIINAFKGKTKVKLPDELKEAVETASLTINMDKNVANSVKIELSENKLKCSGASAKGEIEKNSKVVYSGKETTFSINALFLLQVLSKATTMIIREDGQQAMFRSGNFRHLMALPV